MERVLRLDAAQSPVAGAHCCRWAARCLLGPGYNPANRIPSQSWRNDPAIAVEQLCRPGAHEGLLCPVPSRNSSNIASGIRGLLRRVMSGVLPSKHVHPHAKFPTGLVDAAVAWVRVVTVFARNAGPSALDAVVAPPS